MAHQLKLDIYCFSIKVRGERDAEHRTFGEFFRENYSREDENPLKIDKEILIDKPQTCFKDWEGQGYWGDLDLNNNDPLNKIHDPKWFMARQYYWLQIQKKVSINYIHIMRAGTGTTFIFHEKKIAEYFKKNPNTLPQPENVRKFRSEEGILDFD